MRPTRAEVQQTKQHQELITEAIEILKVIETKNRLLLGSARLKKNNTTNKFIFDVRNLYRWTSGGTNYKVSPLKL